jgi:hypothetical protein
MDDILQLPRKPSQRWVFITDESPQNTNLFKDKLNGKLVRAECVRQRNEVAIIQGIISLSLFLSPGLSADLDSDWLMTSKSSLLIGCWSELSASTSLMRYGDGSQT